MSSLASNQHSQPQPVAEAITPGETSETHQQQVIKDRSTDSETVPCISVALVAILGEILRCTIRIAVALVYSSLTIVYTHSKILAELAHLWLVLADLIFKVFFFSGIDILLKIVLWAVWLAETVFHEWRALWRNMPPQ